MQKHFLTIAFTVVLHLVLFSPSVAQQPLLGISNSNYAGTHGLYLNPAFLADSRYKVYVNLATVDGFATNTYTGYAAPFSPWQLVTDRVPAQYKNADGSVDFKGEYIRENRNGKPKQGSIGAEIRGPSFLLKLNAKSSLAFSTRLRQYAQASDVSENFAHLLKTGLDAYSFIGELNRDNQFNVNFNSFAEIGLSYAQVLTEQDGHFLKGGLTVKRLVGLYSAHFINRGTDYRVVADPLDPTQTVLQVDRLSAQYGYIDPDSYSNSFSGKWLTGSGAPGNGWGFDLGFAYENRPSNDGQYQYRIGLALTDIGGISYDNPQFVRSYDITRQNLTFNPADYEDVNDGEDLVNVLEDVLQLQNETPRTSFFSGLPTALNATFDYRILPNLYANVTWIQSVKSKSSIAMRQSSLLAITPRFEMKWVEVALPLSLINDYGSLVAGAMLRVGPLLVGSDSLGGLFNIGTPYGADVYAGLSVPIFSKQPPPSQGPKARRQRGKPRSS